MNTPLLIQEVTPEQVASIQTLKGKQLHITLDHISSMGDILLDYGKLISIFLEDNMAKDIIFSVKTIYLTGNRIVSVVIITITDTYVN